MLKKSKRKWGELRPDVGIHISEADEKICVFWGYFGHAYGWGGESSHMFAIVFGKVLPLAHKTRLRK